MKKLIITLLVLLPLVSLSKDTIKSNTLRKQLLKAGIQHSEIVLKQAILETGWFKSSAFKTKNNLWGFTYKGKVMTFKSISHCIDYMKKWQDKYYISKEWKDYYEFLKKKGFASDSLYIKKLKSIK